MHVPWPLPVTTELGASLEAPLPFPPARAGAFQSLSPGHGTSVLSVPLSPRCTLEVQRPPSPVPRRP
ncbi:hypothetical protein D623_10004361 [Myotis brandtii]|uniref:Uncharacterized protein n=1 Tax=Myotis brandtii TaxID=109478 RepID=S7PN06_MYOBR|nr:hypothetical protein D623_10004361 [Myotis brandtii]